MKDFPSITNFLICTFVALIGLYWLRKFNQEDVIEDRYIFRSYLCWWFSWVIWAITWFIIAFTSIEKDYPILIVALSDLNAIFLIVLYFHLTRGNAYKPIWALLDFGYLVTVISAGYLIFSFLLPEAFYDLQKGWGLVLSAVSTLLVGWAFRFRYHTRAVLVVGFIYAFSQPLIYNAVLPSELSSEIKHSTEAAFEAFKFALAILKVFWATIITIYFVQPCAVKENLGIGTEKDVWFPTLKQIFKGLLRPLLIQTFILVAIIAFVAFQQLTALAKSTILLFLVGIILHLAIVSLVGKFLAWLKNKIKENESQQQYKKMHLH